MMFKDSKGDETIHYYPSNDNKKWKLIVHDFLVQDAKDENTYNKIDPDNNGMHFANATVDTFYRAVLMPSVIFERFERTVHDNFNVTGPAAGLVFCNDSAT